MLSLSGIERSLHCEARDFTITTIRRYLIVHGRSWSYWRNFTVYHSQYLRRFVRCHCILKINICPTWTPGPNFTKHNFHVFPTSRKVEKKSFISKPAHYQLIEFSGIKMTVFINRQGDLIDEKKGEICCSEIDEGCLLSLIPKI